MKHHILRGCAGVLALSLCLSLAACGGGSDDDTPSATSPADNNPTPPADSTKPVLHCAP
jgi:hypothetical protein